MINFNKPSSGIYKSSSMHHNISTQIDSSRKQQPFIIGKKQIGLNRYKLIPISKSKLQNYEQQTNLIGKRTKDISFQHPKISFQTQIKSMKDQIRNKKYDIYRPRQDQFYSQKYQRRFITQNLTQGPQTDFYLLKQGIQPKNNIKELQQKFKKPIWEQKQNSVVQRIDINKKLYKLKNKRISTEVYKQFENNQQDRIIPIINKISIGKQKRQLYRLKDMTVLPSLNRYIPIQKYKNRYNLQYRYNNYHRIMRSYKSFRKVTHAILFTIYLKKYNQRMRIDRQYKFHKIVKMYIQQSLVKLKAYIIESMKPFFLMLIDQQNFDYKLSQKDTFVYRKQKLQSIKKLMQIQAECMQNCIIKIINKEQIVRLLYYLCKHGNYACIQAIYTAQQLNSSCISEAYGYMSCNRYLQQSLIMLIVFIKLQLYNIFFKPQKMELFIDKIYDKKIIFNNIKLFGNILYQILIDIQDDLFQKTSDVYTINNWQNYRNKFKIKVAASMTVKKDIMIKNQLISGLQNHNIIRDIYEISQMTKVKKKIEKLLYTLQKSIANYHRNIRKDFL